ncbi:hypothetical protein ACUNDQ_18575 [Pectobacterium brasiliense]|uniref:hypothetical protein n=1 Tax=Pectobacterium brasiliense TaxID=180957 RepID=UPI0040449884
MKSKIMNANDINNMPDWLSIQEAVRKAKNQRGVKITESDIYRNALRGLINLSIYFQTSISLRKISITNHKPRLHTIDKEIYYRLCMLDKNCFINDRNLIISTEGSFLYPRIRIIDTPLFGYEYILTQRLLARALDIPLPMEDTATFNYGITITMPDGVFQLFEKTTWLDRLRTQKEKLPEKFSRNIADKLSDIKTPQLCRTGHFPLYDLPSDACFVIRSTELEKLIFVCKKNKSTQQPHTSTRISTPLSRLFWLACKHNEAINPLIRQPYKLLSIFEQWASDDGITDHLSGDTLKNALERGTPSSASLSN